MKAKIFEWTDETLHVPATILADPQAQFVVELAIGRAEDWSRRLAAVHRRTISDQRDQRTAARARMLSAYWIALAEPFRRLVQSLSDSSDLAAVLNGWSADVLETGRVVFALAVDEIGTRGEALQKRADALRAERAARRKQIEEWTQ